MTDAPFTEMHRETLAKMLVSEAEAAAIDAALRHITLLEVVAEANIVALRQENDRLKAELAAIDTALGQSGGVRAGLLAIDRITELITQRNADEARCVAWQEEVAGFQHTLRQANIRIDTLEARLDECRQAKQRETP